MGTYAEWLFPRLLDLVMRQKRTMPFRDRIGKAAAGRVLDVGTGSGVNLPYYGDAVKHLCGVDPSPQLLRSASERARNAPVAVEFVCSGAETLPLNSKGVDRIALTFTLCTIGDPRAALAQMRPVLKAGGGRLSAEHGRSPEAAVARWQDRVDAFVAGAQRCTKPKMLGVSTYFLRKILLCRLGFINFLRLPSLICLG